MGKEGTAGREDEGDESGGEEEDWGRKRPFFLSHSLSSPKRKNDQTGHLFFPPLTSHHFDPCHFPSMMMLMPSPVLSYKH